MNRDERAERRTARRTAVATQRKAQSALSDYCEAEWKKWRAAGNKGGMPETEEYHRLNGLACDAATDPALPWWRR